jgi:hypothetical protein
MSNRSAKGEKSNEYKEGEPRLGIASNETGRTVFVFLMLSGSKKPECAIFGPAANLGSFRCRFYESGRVVIFSGTG